MNAVAVAAAEAKERMIFAYLFFKNLLFVRYSRSCLGTSHIE